MQAKTSFYIAPLLLFSVVASANPANQLADIKVKVFTSQTYPIQQSHLADVVYHLDSVEKLEESFLPNLSTDPTQAEQQVRQVMKTTEWKQFETKLKIAYQGVIEGWKQGVMKIPAVVFETSNPAYSSVIYGETDVGKAIVLYRDDLLKRGNFQ
ncbi:TIGR03757 family integrating conjugative element protein [Muribacter muris]|uniref:TIGR03757 family integrating conjugative element protein n=1 Tax=Muribacter muris TaxID=67855 RepID=A0A4Y9JQF9_9PAST|nr:TIGR03757 family integrating conjugative element protein [Muribacter muris]MBF0786136.1 TIGR03757 family integrating conjugative element protein [Muribacter muris]MBF0827343.1 TIGR03757 family integrating conjugative element protein [Muribacter muris]TFV07808.1 TIGR03757 family integrating conjugative element protein [Muribacter muris]